MTYLKNYILEMLKLLKIIVLCLIKRMNIMIICLIKLLKYMKTAFMEEDKSFCMLIKICSLRQVRIMRYPLEILHYHLSGKKTNIIKLKQGNNSRKILIKTM